MILRPPRLNRTDTRLPSRRRSRSRAGATSLPAGRRPARGASPVILQAAEPRATARTGRLLVALVGGTQAGRHTEPVVAERVEAAGGQHHERDDRYRCEHGAVAVFAQQSAHELGHADASEPGPDRRGGVSAAEVRLVGRTWALRAGDAPLPGAHADPDARSEEGERSEEQTSELQ